MRELCATAVLRASFCASFCASFSALAAAFRLAEPPPDPDEPAGLASAARAAHFPFPFAVMVFRPFFGFFRLGGLTLHLLPLFLHVFHSSVAFLQIILRINGCSSTSVLVISPGAARSSKLLLDGHVGMRQVPRHVASLLLKPFAEDGAIARQHRRTKQGATVAATP